MANYNISLYRPAHYSKDGLTFGKTIAFIGTLDEAKRRGEALRREFPGGQVTLTGPRGGKHVLERKAWDTGPYAWVWHREPRHV